MKPRKVTESVYLLGAVDWDRRLFDSLIPLPDGTSYNAYLVRGSEKTALIDSADPAKTEVLMKQLKEVDRIDYIVANHAEQDHSGSIPAVLKKYPDARICASEKCKGMLVDHLGVSSDSIIDVDDGELISLGGLTLKFIHTPWVHWPETICTYVPEKRILFSCDFFGSHYATSKIFTEGDSIVYEAAKRYYAEIMMPFRAMVKKNIETVTKSPIDIIAPSHGPLYKNPEFIIDAYKDWISDTPKNLVVIPYISMHGSTKMMVDYMVASLAEKDIEVKQFDLTVTDIGKLAISLVDAATIIVATPTVHIGPHPAVFYASHLANALRPKLRFASVIGSYGWSSKATEKIAELIPNLKVEILPGVMCKGMPREVDFEKLEVLAGAIAEKHKGLNLA
jgi:flavorubredoxin